MKVLVLGGTRFIGKNAVSALLDNGYEVFIATRGRAEDPFDENVSRIHISDRNDALSLRENLGVFHFDIVLDCLAFDAVNVKILLDNVSCNKYVLISSTSVYNKIPDTVEKHFNPYSYPVKFQSRAEGISFAEGKKNAEACAFQLYDRLNPTAFRFPFTLGVDDYTNRLLFYVEHVIYSKPMYIDDWDSQISFVDAGEAGAFIGYMIGQDFTGSINGCSSATISIKEIVQYIELKSLRKCILDVKGDSAPFNGQNNHSISNKRATMNGFQFSNLHDWIFNLLDKYIEQVKEQVNE